MKSLTQKINESLNESQVSFTDIVQELQIQGYQNIDASNMRNRHALLTFNDRSGEQITLIEVGHDKVEKLIDKKSSGTYSYTDILDQISTDDLVNESLDVKYNKLASQIKDYVDSMTVSGAKQVNALHKLFVDNFAVNHDEASKLVDSAIDNDSVEQTLRQLKVNSFPAVLESVNESKSTFGNELFTKDQANEIALKLKQFFRSHVDVKKFGELLSSTEYNSEFNPTTNVAKMTELLNSTSDIGTANYVRVAVKDIVMNSVTESEELVAMSKGHIFEQRQLTVELSSMPEKLKSKLESAKGVAKVFGNVIQFVSQNVKDEFLNTEPNIIDDFPEVKLINEAIVESLTSDNLKKNSTYLIKQGRIEAYAEFIECDGDYCMFDNSGEKIKVKSCDVKKQVFNENVNESKEDKAVSTAIAYYKELKTIYDAFVKDNDYDKLKKSFQSNEKRHFGDDNVHPMSDESITSFLKDKPSDKAVSQYLFDSDGPKFVLQQLGLSEDDADELADKVVAKATFVNEDSAGS